jgi:hypothetical protein
MGLIDFVVLFFLLTAEQKPIVTIHSSESDCDGAKTVLLETYPAAVIADCTPIYKAETVKAKVIKRAPVKKYRPRPTQKKKR